MFDEGDCEEEHTHEHIDNSSMFVYLPNHDKNNNKDFIYFDSPSDEIVFMQGASMNENYVFFWNLGSVWKLDLSTQILSKLSIYISEKEV